MPPLTRLPPALKQLPFTAAQARAAGLSARVLQGPAVRELFERVYLAAEVEPSLQLEVMGARLVVPPGTVVGGVTALQLLGIDLGPRRPLRFWTTWERQVRRSGLKVTRVAKLPPVRAQMLAGAAIFRTAAEELSLVDLVAGGDFLVRHRHTSTAELIEVADTGGRGRVSARRAARLVRGGVDSPQETRTRLLLVLAGLPEPEVNRALHVDGEFLGTPDLSYRRWRLLIEYEGDQHRADPEQWAYDLRRYERMSATGHVVIRVARDHLREPRGFVDRVHRALVAGGFAGPAPCFGPEWVDAFETSAGTSAR